MVPVFSLVLALTLCALAASALFAPGFVFGTNAGAGTQPPESPGQPDSAADKTGSPVVSEGVLLFSLPWGKGEGQVGLARPTDGLTRGPESLAVAPDGCIVVLDSVNKRLVLLDEAGHRIGTIAIPLAEPRFLAVDDRVLYVLDCDADRQILAFAWDGTVSNRLPLPDLPDVVTGLFATPDGPCVEVAHESVLLIADAAVVPSTGGVGPDRTSLRQIAGRPVDPSLSRAARVTFSPGAGVVVESLRIDRRSMTAERTGLFRPSLAHDGAIEHLVSVDGDGADGLVIGARLLEAATPGARPASAGADASPGANPGVLLVAKLDCRSASGRVTGTLLLSESSFAYVGQPYVVAPDGRVLQPVADPSGYSVLVHAFAEAERPATYQEALP